MFMSEQVVLITGALTGIGRATAVAFAGEGAKIVVSGRHDKEGQELVIELRNLGAEAEFVRADVRQEKDIEKLVDFALSRFGRLDVAVNNAGTEGKPGPFTDQTAETYAATFDTNVLGTLLSMTRVPMKRIGQPEEAAEAILFLASDKASFITGASLASDGGKLAR
jgi:NAD(P)-dependent dehydrogenase (short-subunit alcohol dehydrogenase family)